MTIQKTKHLTPLVTIGIPIYNADKYLEFAIQSVLNQSYQNWELLLMNDGSSDNSLQIAKKFENIDKRIQVFSNGKNLGLPTRLNELSELANGVYYARMDADDIMHPDRIEKQVNYLMRHPEIDLLATSLVSIDNENNIIGVRKGTEKAKFELNDLLKNGGWAAHPTIMGKSLWFKQHFYDEKLTRTEDFDLWMRTIENSHFSKINIIGLYYREESTPTLKKYLFSSRQIMILYWKNRKIMGLYYFVKFNILTVFKTMVYIIFSLLGKTMVLIKKRSHKMSSLTQKKHQNILLKYQINDLE
jgi:glycosyltransferase involved in cell wall biosynthesis